MFNTMESFLLMIILMMITSYIIMSNVMLTFKNGVYNHLNKVYMAILMGILMSLISFILMLNVDIKNKNLWLSLFISLILLLIFIIIIRKQTFINDKQFLKSMIEHHDGAILMSEKILKKTKDKKLVLLANNIINSQQYEIDLMKSWL